MGNVISNLKAKFGIDTTDFKRGLKDGEKATADFKDAAGSQLDEFASMFGINMGAVNSALGTAQKSLNFLGQSFKAAATSSGALSAALKILKFALVATGIGAIIVLLGSVIAYFQKTGEGADKFAKILMQIKSVVNNVIERFAVFGKGIWELMTGKFKQGWETMRSAFKGIGDEIKEDWKAAGDLADREDALEDREIALINSLEERRAKSAELRLMAKEEQEDQKKKLDLLNQAEALTKSVFGDQISLERERLAIMKEKLAIQTSDPTDEQNREIAEQEAKINQLLREQSQELKGIVRERNAAKLAVEEEVKLEKLKADQIGITVAETSKLKLPDLSQGVTQLQGFTITIQKAVKDVSDSLKEMNAAIETSVEAALAGFGEWVGNFMTGMSTSDELIQMIGNVFGNMLIQLGEVAIATGVGIEAIKKSFENLEGYQAVIAGVALVALGTAVKSAVKNIGSNLVGTSGSSSSGTSVFDMPGSSASSRSNTVALSGEIKLKAEGPDLVAVINANTLNRTTNT